MSKAKIAGQLLMDIVFDEEGPCEAVFFKIEMLRSCVASSVLQFKQLAICILSASSWPAQLPNHKLPNRLSATPPDAVSRVGS
eukprot:5757426-Amphidinium_carterae.1